jgi:ubiquinone/menaquinone biosynthesis C-methylase UbiE
MHTLICLLLCAELISTAKALRRNPLSLLAMMNGKAKGFGNMNSKSNSPLVQGDSNKKGFGVKSSSTVTTSGSLDNNPSRMEASIQQGIHNTPGLRDAMNAYNDIVSSTSDKQQSRDVEQTEGGWSRLSVHNKLLELTWDAAAEFRDNRHADMVLTNEMENYLQLISEKILTPNLGENKILDVGCGNAIILKYIKSYAKQEGIDFNDKCFYGCYLSSQMINISKSKYPLANFLQCDFLEYPIPSSSFTAIIFNECLHNFVCIQDALSHAAQLLLPNGILIISHPKGYSNVLTQARANKWLVPSVLPSENEWSEDITTSIGLRVELKGNIKSPQYLAVLRKIGS